MITFQSNPKQTLQIVQLVHRLLMVDTSVEAEPERQSAKGRELWLIRCGDWTIEFISNVCAIRTVQSPAKQRAVAAYLEWLFKVETTVTIAP